MACSSTAGSDPSRVYYGTDTRAAACCSARRWPSCGRSAAALRRRPAAPRALLDVAGVAAWPRAARDADAGDDYDALALPRRLASSRSPRAVLIAAVVHPACASGALGIAPLRWIGARSYGIYLWHWPVMVLTRPGIDVHWPPPLLLAFQIGLTVALAAVSYR